MEVTNCFAVPHKEYEERVEADLKYAEDMFDLNKKVSKNFLKWDLVYINAFSSFFRFHLKKPSSGGLPLATKSPRIRLSFTTTMLAGPRIRSI